MSYETITKTSTGTRYVEDEPAINADGTAAREVSWAGLVAGYAAALVIGVVLLALLVNAG